MVLITLGGYELINKNSVKTRKLKAIVTKALENLFFNIKSSPIAIGVIIKLIRTSDKSQLGNFILPASTMRFIQAPLRINNVHQIS